MVKKIVGFMMTALLLVALLPINQASAATKSKIFSVPAKASSYTINATYGEYGQIDPSAGLRTQKLEIEKDGWNGNATLTVTDKSTKKVVLSKNSLWSTTAFNMEKGHSYIIKVTKKNTKDSSLAKIKLTAK